MSRGFSLLRCGSQVLAVRPEGASVLSASRLEPLAPCMGLVWGFSCQGVSARRRTSFISFFVDPKAVPSSRPALRPCRRAQELSRLAVAPTYVAACSAFARPYLDCSEHDGTSSEREAAADGIGRLSALALKQN